MSMSYSPELSMFEKELQIGEYIQALLKGQTFSETDKRRQYQVMLAAAMELNKEQVVSSFGKIAIQQKKEEVADMLRFCREALGDIHIREQKEATENDSISESN